MPDIDLMDVVIVALLVLMAYVGWAMGRDTKREE